MSRVSSPSGRRIRLLPIAVVVVAAILGEGLADREAAGTAERSSTVDAVVGSMVSDLSVSHIRVEEIVAGDQTVDVKSDIVENQTSAARQCRVLRDGGSSRFGRVDPFEDRTAAATVAETCRRLDRFRLLTERRLRAPLAVRRAGSAAETRYDRAFASFLTAAGTTQAELRELGRRERRRMQVVQVGIVVLLSSLVIASVLLIRRRDDQLAIAARDRESLLQSAGEGIVAFDRDGRLHFANGAAAAMLGWRPEELARHGVRDLLARGDQRPSGLPEWLDVDRPSRGQGRELVRRDGSAFPVAYHVAPAGPRDDDGDFPAGVEGALILGATLAIGVTAVPRSDRPYGDRPGGRRRGGVQRRLADQSRGRAGAASSRAAASLDHARGRAVASHA